MITQKEVVRLLIQIGCSITCKGFSYLYEAICLLLAHEKTGLNLSTQVYAAIARKYDTSEDNIECAIRTIIKKCWNESCDELQKISLAKLTYPPTVKEYLSIIFVHLKFSA